MASKNNNTNSSSEENKAFKNVHAPLERPCVTPERKISTPTTPGAPRRNPDMVESRKRTYEDVLSTQYDWSQFEDAVEDIRRLDLFGENNPMRDQMGDILATVIPSLKKLAMGSSSPQIESKLAVHVTRLVLTYAATTQCTTTLGVGATIAYHLSFYADADTYTELSGYVQSILRPLTDQSSFDSVVQVNASDPEWLAALKNMHWDWQTFVSCPLFPQLSKLLGLSVLCGFVDKETVTFSLGDYELIAPAIIAKQKSASSLLDAAMQTIIFFVDKVYYLLKTGSLAVLFANDGIYDVDKAFHTVSNLWLLVQNGNPGKVNGIDVSEFETLKADCLERLKSLVLTASSPYEKQIYTTKLNALTKIDIEHTNYKRSQSLRKAPYTVQVYGGSSVGKSSVCSYISNILMSSITPPGRPLGRRYVINFKDPYFSGADSAVRSVHGDDFGNNKRDDVDEGRMLLDIANNIPFTPNMAGVEEKGKVVWDPDVFTISTNFQDLQASKFSNCPVSLQRRPNVVIEVEVKPQFSSGDRLDSDKVPPRRKWKQPDGSEVEAPFDDVWFFTLYTVEYPEDMANLGKYHVLKHKGKLMKKINFFKLRDYLLEDFFRYREQQSILVDKLSESNCRIEMCPHPGCTKFLGECTAHREETEEVLKDQIFEEALVSGVISGANFLSTKYTTNAFGRKIEANIEKAAVFSAKAFYNWFDPIWFIPSSWVQSPLFLKVCMWFGREKLWKIWMKRSAQLLGMYVLLVYLFHKYTTPFSFISKSYFTIAFSLLLFPAWLLLQLCLVYRVRSEFKVELVRRNMITATAAAWREQYMGAILASTAVLGAAYLACKVYLRVSEAQKLSDQGNLNPTTKEEIEERDNEVNEWHQHVKEVLPTSKDCKCMTTTTLVSNCLKQLFHAHIICLDENSQPTGKEGHGNLFAVTTGAVLVPAHFFKNAEKLLVNLAKVGEKNGVYEFQTILWREHAVQFSSDGKDKDLLLCYMPTGGSMKNLVRYFPESIPQSFPIQLHWKGKPGENSDLCIKALASSQFLSTESGLYQGYRYPKMSSTSFDGLCGGVVIGDQRAPFIAGIHTTGSSYTGGCPSITRADLEEAVELLSNMRGVTLVGSNPEKLLDNFGAIYEPKSELHYKSPLKFLPEGAAINYHGGMGTSATFKSQVTDSPLSHHITEVTGVPNKWGPPFDKPSWACYQRMLESMSTKRKPFDPEILQRSVEDYLLEIDECLDRDLTEIRPLSSEENINGIEGLKFVDRTKGDTAACITLPGVKNDYLIDLPATEDLHVRKDYQPEIKERMAEIQEQLKRGERCFIPAKANKKDETLPLSKKKCRGFFANSLYLTFFLRRYYLLIVRFMQMFPLSTECAVGINASGPEWEELMNHVERFGAERGACGDYKNYDVSIQSQLLLSAFGILHHIAERSGYSKEDLTCMKAIAADVVFALVSFNGDLIGILSSGHISGNSLTVILNGVVNSLLLRYVFYSTKENWGRKFRSYVAAITYGDDVDQTVHESISSYNIVEIARVLSEHGMVFTMPDKSADLKEFVPAEDQEFLKRKSVYCPQRKCKVGALSEASIFKMIHCILYTKKNPLTKEHAAVVNIDTALREWALHGEEKYEERRIQMRQVLEKAQLLHLSEVVHWTYADHIEKWRSKYDKDYVKYSVVYEDDELFEQGLWEPANIPHPSGGSGCQGKAKPPHTTGYPDLDSIDNPRSEALCARENPRVRPLFNGGVPPPVKLRSDRSNRSRRNKRITKTKTNENNIINAKELDEVDARANHECKLKDQMEESTSTTSKHSKYQNVKFSDYTEDFTTTVASSSDPTRTMMDTTDVSLGDFLKRPVKIAEYVWRATGTDLFEQIDPWSAFLGNPRVINRLNNYNLFRGDLHIKIVINGNSFHYGRAIAHYLPLRVFDDASIIDNSINTLVQATQQPHVYLNPTTSSGGEMVLPFFYHKNCVSIPNAEWDRLGELTIRSINGLYHANNGDDFVTISVFAWSENVTLSVPTSVNSSVLTDQVGEEQTEGTRTGLVSGPASTISKAAGVLSSMPMIGPYAMATSKVAAGVSSLAKALGYSRPKNVANPSTYEPRSISSLALTNVPDNAHSLAIDEKQELTIDPRIAGISSEDTLVINSIAKRESYLTTFSWPMGTAPAAFLWNAEVDPVLCRKDDEQNYYLPALAVAAIPFKYWTGSLKFRFQIVAAAFHRGRLQFTYDPVQVQGNEFNVNYTEIVDIAERRDFTMEIGNAQSTNLLTHAYVGIDDAYHGTAPIVKTNAERVNNTGNGVISVSVLNQLTAPSADSQPISINVFVSAGDDFEVFVPNDEFMYFGLNYTVQFNGRPPDLRDFDTPPPDVEPLPTMQVTTVEIGGQNYLAPPTVVYSEDLPWTFVVADSLGNEFNWTGDDNYGPVSEGTYVVTGSAPGAPDVTDTVDVGGIYTPTMQANTKTVNSLLVLDEAPITGADPAANYVYTITDPQGNVTPWNGTDDVALSPGDTVITAAAPGYPTLTDTVNVPPFIDWVFNDDGVLTSVVAQGNPNNYVVAADTLPDPLSIGDALPRGPSVVTGRYTPFNNQLVRTRTEEVPYLTALWMYARDNSVLDTSDPKRVLLTQFGPGTSSGGINIDFPPNPVGPGDDFASVTFTGVFYENPELPTAGTTVIRRQGFSAEDRTITPGVPFTETWTNVPSQQQFIITQASAGNQTYPFVDLYVEVPGLVWTPTQMEEVDGVNDRNDPEHPDTSMLALPENNSININKVYTGESIGSFRTMGKRFNLWTAIGGSTETGPTNFYGRRNAYPYYSGEVPGAPVNGNQSNTVFLHWMTLPFSGRRGGIRYKMVPRGNFTTSDRLTVEVNRTLSRFGVQNYSSSEPSEVYTTPEEAAFSARSNVLYTDGVPKQGHNGKAYTTSEVNPCLEFEVPYYSRKRFEPGKPLNLQTVSADEEQNCYDYKIMVPKGNNIVYDMYVAAGEDYQVFFFTGMPPLKFRFF